MAIGRGDTLTLAVEVPGADQGERALGRVEAAARRVVSATDTAGRSTGGLSGAMRSLDDAVDSVEKPMRALNGALDIASVALGVGLAGPLGVVLGQFIDLAKSISAAIEVTAPYERATLDAADAATKLAAAEQEAAKQVAARVAAQRTAGTSAATRAVEAIGAGIDPQTLDRLVTAGRTLESLTQQRTALVGALEPGRVTETQTRELDALTRAIERTREELRGLGAEGVGATVAATAATTKAGAARVEVRKQEASSIKGIEEALRSLDPLVARASEDVRAARLSREVEAGTRGVSDGLFPSSRSTADVLAQGADAFDPEAVPRAATATEAAFSSTLTAATDLSTIGVQALQTFSQAAGSALASVVINGDAVGQSFRQVIGQTAAGLSATLFSYSIFLGVMAAIAGLTGGILGFAGAQIGTAALAAGAGAVTLGLIARAAGASTRGGTTGASRTASGGGGGGRGGGDRVASLSQGTGGGAMPVNVTVILGVDQVSRVLVDGSRREARAGSMSGNRLAVA